MAAIVLLVCIGALVGISLFLLTQESVHDEDDDQ